MANSPLQRSARPRSEQSRTLLRRYKKRSGPSFAVGDQLARLEKLEALALGIDGKGALWRSLQAVAEEIPALREVDLSSLNRRAEEQRQRVEKLRIEAAREAFVR